jgi:Cytidylate kinase-like family
MEYPLSELLSTEFKPSSESLAEQLENALHRWRKRRAGPPPVDLRPTPPPFTIALNCEAGANGPALARQIGLRLGWYVYDHELVEWIAREMGVRAELLKSVDEKQKSWFEEAFEAFFVGRPVSPVAYVHHLVKTLLALAAHGECIFVGRGGAQVLPPQTTLGVRLVGPLKERIAAIQRRFGYAPDEAARWVEQRDHERRAFVQEYLHRDVTDPDQYDLLLNAFRLSAEQGVELTVIVLHMRQEWAVTQTLAPTAASG